MRWSFAPTFLLILATLMPAYGQDQPAPPRATEIPTEGFWPTRKMMDRIIDRIVDQMADHYEFDEEQTETTRILLKERYPAYLNENRAEIQTLLNQYFEALVNDQPPTPEEVAEWATRVQPLLAGLGDLTHEVTDEMHTYLNDQQAVTLDAEVTAFDTGMRFAQNKLSAWAAGEYDPTTEWIHPPNENRQAEDAPDDQPDEPDVKAAAGTAPVDEWAVYAQRFIERYQLNDQQKQKAHLILRRQQEARDKYLRRKVDEMARVTKQLSEATTEESRQAALRAYEQLNAPVDQLFRTLKERLLTLPTRAQRKAAEEAGLTAEDQLAPAPPEETFAEETAAEQPATSQETPEEPENP